MSSKFPVTMATSSLWTSHCFSLSLFVVVGGWSQGRETAREREGERESEGERKRERERFLLLVHSKGLHKLGMAG